MSSQQTARQIKKRAKWRAKQRKIAGETEQKKPVQDVDSLAHYGKLKDGLVQIGAQVKNGDVLIGRTSRDKKSDLPDPRILLVDDLMNSSDKKDALSKI